MELHAIKLLPITELKLPYVKHGQPLSLYFCFIPFPSQPKCPEFKLSSSHPYCPTEAIFVTPNSSMVPSSSCVMKGLISVSVGRNIFRDVLNCHSRPRK